MRGKVTGVEDTSNLIQAIKPPNGIKGYITVVEGEPV